MQAHNKKYAFAFRQSGSQAYVSVHRAAEGGPIDTEKAHSAAKRHYKGEVDAISASLSKAPAHNYGQSVVFTIEIIRG